MSGEKTVETRGYPLPAKYAGKPLAIIETPGPTKPRFKARIVGVITFSHSMQYKTYAEWDADRGRHRVPANDPALLNPGKFLLTHHFDAVLLKSARRASDQ